MAKREPAQELLPSYGETFLEQHAGRIVVDPETAIVELVANSWDAGADRVDVAWPPTAGARIAVADNGIGMTREELEHRWFSMFYDRQTEQGEDVVFPEGVPIRPRKAWGCNGVGRHAMFCFADEYTVETVKDGARTVALVRRSTGKTPYTLQVTAQSKSEGHGTTISATAREVRMSDAEVRDALGARFVVDPQFAIWVDGNPVSLTDIEAQAELHVIEVPEVGKLNVRRFDAEVGGRTSRQNGVAWWVRRRLVGAPSWDLGLGPILDSRRAAAKRYTYIVEADPLATFVKPDWSGLFASPKVIAAQRAIDDFVREDINSLLGDARRERKRHALTENKAAIQELGPVSQDQIAAFLEEIQKRCPNLGDKELADAVEVLAKLEKSRSGYALIEKLAKVDPNDLDSLNHLLSEWSIQDAKTVLNELRYRLALIQRLEQLINDGKTDELHELQPLFERGLWIFGPELEGPQFMSNRTLATIVREFFGGGTAEEPRKRPDFVALPNASIGVYTRDEFDERHEVSGIGHVVVVELKRGGFDVSRKEKQQAQNYCGELRASGKIKRTTRITAYVLGSTIASEAEENITEGATTVLARPYDVVLRSAHARTFHLLKLLNFSVTASDEDVRDLVKAEQTSIFEAMLPGR
jgi:hypothetical protein